MKDRWGKDSYAPTFTAGDTRCDVHDWETGGEWGVILGVSRCKRCGKTSSRSDFPTMELSSNEQS